MKRRGRFAVLAVLAGVVVTAAAFTSAAQGTHARKGPSAGPSTSCQLGDKGKIKHVIYLQFDNVHFQRDNPNVPSDLEQMPHLLNFLKDNGTFDTNDHTILISHTGGGILSSLTGLYPDRHGQAVSNSYGYFRPDGSVGFSSSFKYWTDFTDGGNPANNPPTPSADANYNMVNNDSAALGGTGANRNAPGPWVPYTRAGCDVGGAGLANIELENNTAIVTRSSGNTTLAAASTAGAANITVASAANLAPGLNIILENGTVRAETDTISSIVGNTVILAAPLTNAHNNGGAVTVFTADPTGDMTRVFGEGSPEWLEARNSQISPSGTAARNLAQTDFVGYAIHCGNGSNSICNGNPNAKPDPLPDEAGGYAGFKALFGPKYVNPAINHGKGCIQNIDGTGNVADQFGQCGFPGFDGLFPKNTLAEVATMQEAGIPVTFGYLSDAHDGHGLAGEIHHAYGPGEAGYVQQLHDYDQSFANFFTRLQHDGITKDNTLFVVTVEEGDHFAGTQPSAPCDGVVTACTYANVSEVNADLKRLVATYNANHGTSATTDFSVHSDLVPNVYVTGNPARDSAKARDLEKATADLTVTNPYSHVQQKLFVAAADPVEEKILHMVTADPARTPTFSPFAQGDYFLSAAPGTPATCTNNDPNQCLTTAVTNPNSSFAWNHGGLQPEIRNTWIGWVGPGIATKGQTDRVWTDHTDIRPTMLSLLGLKDDYVSDGRVVNEFLKGANGNDNSQGNDDDQGDDGLQSAHKLDALGALYKQLNASFGDFSMNTLCASTAALGSTSAGDTTYSSIENALQSLGAQRDTLANAIRAALWNAEFNGQKLDQKQVKDWIKQGQSYLDQAAALCSQFQSGSNAKELGKLKHIVVIYEENHSFDNLFGGWEGVNGLNNVHQSGVGDHVTQVDQNGVPFGCLQQLDVNLSTNPQYAGLPVTCTDALHNIQSHFPNGYFSIDGFIAPSDITCPPITNAFGFANGILKQGLDPNTHNPVPGARAGGCTRDLVHEFYQEQYQIHGGAQDRYMSGSDSVGTSMGVYDTKQLPVYKYLHSKGAPHYAIDDNFFQSAFGGSFLNHQWLIAAASPVDPTGVPGGAHAGSHSIIDSNGMPVAYPQYTPTGPVQRNPLTVSCPATPPAAVCGNWAVNTMQPAVNPQGAFSQILPLQTGTTIGDRLTAAGVDWAWYSGGWANANGDLTDPGYTNQKTPAATPSGCSDPNVDTGVRAGVPVAAWPRCPDALFQYHHQPFNYYANYAPGTPGRAHLQDEVDFEKLAQSSDKHACNLKPVSFIKPIGEENEHPGYASQPNGNDHLVELLQMIEQTGCKKDTMVVVTYDEFGGQWDHVSPPGQGNNNGPHDVWGPGTRIPALILSPHIKGRFVVDSAEHDTTSILATIEHRYGLAPLSSRDAAVNDLATVYSAKKPHDH